MLWDFILGSVICACALASKYTTDQEQTYQMQQFLNFNNFIDIQNVLAEISAAVNPKTGLKNKAYIAGKKLHAISPQIKDLCDIIKDLANPCRDGIYRNGKCVNYIRKDKFVGSNGDAENLCHAHFGEFHEESIIDHNGGHGGGYYGGATNGGGYYGGATNGGGYYAGSTNGGGYYGGNTNGGGYYGGNTNGGGYYGDATNGGGHYGDATNGGGYYGAEPNGGEYYGGATNGGGYYDDASNSNGHYGGASNGGGHDGDAAPTEIVPDPSAPVDYYVCYEQPIVNVPKSIYFPEEEEEAGGTAPPPDQFPVASNEFWFSGHVDPKRDEDECPLFAYDGKVLGNYCYILYDYRLSWVEAQEVCLARNGSLCEPPATVAESTVIYSQLKALFPKIMAQIESAAGPNAANPTPAEIWIGWKQATGGGDFISQIAPPLFVSDSDSIFIPSVPSSPAFAAALTEPGSSWMAMDPATTLPYCCQFNLV